MIYVELILIGQKLASDLLEIVTLPFRVCFLSTHSQGINQYHLQKIDNRIIDLDAALHMYTENAHELEQCILMEFWPKTFPYVFLEVNHMSLKVQWLVPGVYQSVVIQLPSTEDRESFLWNIHLKNASVQV